MNIKKAKKVINAAFIGYLVSLFIIILLSEVDRELAGFLMRIWGAILFVFSLPLYVYLVIKCRI
jgi:hypothetical protein